VLYHGGMMAMPPRLKHFISFRATAAMECGALFLRVLNYPQRVMRRAPAEACRILAYHQTPLADATSFRRQMKWLVRNREVVGLGELMQRIESGSLATNRLVAVTFDDGFANNYEVAAPILEALGIPACFFIATDFINLAGRGPQALQDWERRTYRFTRASPPMSWDQVRALRSRGFDIGSHSQSHAKISAMSDDALAKDIQQSSAVIAAEIGEPPKFFAYPYGKPDFAPVSRRPAIRSAGSFRACFSTVRGWNKASADHLWMHRDSMEPSFSPALLELFLCGFFDRWAH